MLVWFLYETVFDYANKVAQIEKLDADMASPTFWDVPEKAQETVQQLKNLRSVVEPLRGAINSCDDLAELVSMLDEDPSVATEVETEVGKLEISIEQLELNARAHRQNVLSRVHDAGFRCHGTTRDLSTVLQINHGHLRWFYADNPLIGFHSGETMFDTALGDTELLELQNYNQRRP